MEDATQTPLTNPMPSSPTPPPSPTLSTDPNAKSILILVTYLIPIVFIYTMIKKGDNPFFVWHAKNAAAYLLLILVLNITFRILWGILPSLANTLGVVMNLIYLLLFVMVIYFGAFSAWQGKQGKIPLITGIAQKLPLETWFKRGTQTGGSLSSSPTAPESPPSTMPTATSSPVTTTESSSPTAPTSPAVPSSPSPSSAPSAEQTPPPPPPPPTL